MKFTDENGVVYTGELKAVRNTTFHTTRSGRELSVRKSFCESKDVFIETRENGKVTCCFLRLDGLQKLIVVLQTIAEDYSE